MREEIIDQIAECADNVSVAVQETDASVNRGACIAAALFTFGLVAGIGGTKAITKIVNNAKKKKE